MSATSGVEAQYSRSDLRARITEALQAPAKDSDRLSTNQLGQIDEFHLCGRAATTALANLAAIHTQDHVLDIGATRRPRTAGKRAALICSGGNISLPQLEELIEGR